MLNNNFNELVKKYEKYQSRKRDKLLLFILIVLALCLAGFYLVANSSFIMNSFKEATPEKSEIVQEKIKDASDNETKTIAVQKDAVTKEEVVTKPVARVQVDTPKSQELPDKIYNRAAKEIKQDETFKLEVKERKSLYKLLVADKEQNSYESALSVAKFYYSEKNYEKTVTWAVKASKKDSKQSLPWILYAKSKVILGQSKVAQKALSLYLKHNNSKEAQKLLDTLK